MKLSVVTVCYNSVDTIEETMLSVLNQTYPDIEYIIIDGGSTDGTVEIIKKYADRLAYWVSEPDKGIYDAMNKGISVATGDYINFMNSGDRFFDNEVITDVFSDKTINEYEIIYGDAVFQYPQKNIYRKPLDLSELVKHNCLFHQSMFIRTKRLKDMPYDISFKIAADYKFSYLQFKQGASFKYVPKPISYFEGTSGISSNAISLKMDEIQRITGAEFTLYYKAKREYFIIRSGIRKKLFKIFPCLANYIRNRFFMK